MLETLTKKKIEAGREEFKQCRMSIIKTLLGLTNENDAKIKKLLTDSTQRKAIFERRLEESRAARASKDNSLSA